MNIHEYQAKQLLSKHGVPVPPGEVCKTPEEARAVAGKLFGLGYSQVIVKSQIHAGGRGKGVFKSGKRGGVKICKNLTEVYINAKNMLGNVLVTKQTGPEGKLVRKVLVEVALDVQQELYVGVVLDHSIGRPVMITCKEGGKGLSTMGRIAIYNIFFDTGKSEVKAESADALKAIAEYLNANKTQKVIIVGHTDNTGDFDMNISLSKDRANAVIKKLTSEYAVSGDQLKPYGVGPVSPVASNSTEQGRAQNRRVEIVEQ